MVRSSYIYIYVYIYIMTLKIKKSYYVDREDGVLYILTYCLLSSWTEDVSSLEMSQGRVERIAYTILLFWLKIKDLDCGVIR